MNNSKNSNESQDELFEKRMNNVGGLNLNELSKIHENVSRIVEKKQKDLPILCDRNCKEDKKKQELYRKYVLAKENYQAAPKEFEEARADFYTINKGGIWYANFLEKQSLKTMKGTIGLFKKRFINKYRTIKDIIKSYNIHKKYNNYLSNFGQHYADEVTNLENNASILEDKNNINNRLTYYYQEQIKYINYAISFFQYIYWALLGTFFFFIIFLQKKYMNSGILIVSILFIILPFLIDWILYFITSKLTKTNVVIL